MCATGSAPVGLGMPPERRSQVASGRGAYPATGPPKRLRGVLPSPGCRSTSGTRRPGCPSSSTGTVLAHWPVTATPTTSAPSIPPSASPRRAAADDGLPPGLGVLDLGPADRVGAFVPPPHRLPGDGHVARPWARHCPGRRRGPDASCLLRDRRHRLLGVEHRVHDHLDEVLDLAGQPARDPTVDRARLRGPPRRPSAPRRRPPRRPGRPGRRPRRPAGSAAG